MKISQPSSTPSVPFNKKELAILRSYRTPLQVQRYLRSLPYNWADTLRTFRGVVRHRTANCIEAALAAAAIMERHGYPPLLLDLESIDYLDHVLFLFNKNGYWGTIAKSRDVGLHGRKPVFKTIRQLVRSYVEPYVDGSGRVKGFGVGNLNELVEVNWRTSERSVWVVERALVHMPHRPLKTSERKYQRTLRRFLEYKKTHPDKPFVFYDNVHHWM